MTENSIKRKLTAILCADVKGYSRLMGEDDIEKEEQIYGDGVNIAARIETLAKPSGVSISRTVYNHVQKKLNFGFEYQGDHQVKNIANPIHVYKILTKPEYVCKLIGGKPKSSAKKWAWPLTAVVIVILMVYASRVCLIRGPC